MTPRTKEQNEIIRIRRIAQIVKAAADVYLDKGVLMEIRDVAASAELGYGTVYHYYKNKTDLLHDVLWQAMERAAVEMAELVNSDIAASANQRSYTGWGSRLLKLWARDHGLYLLCQLGGDHFRSLPEQFAGALTVAYHENVLRPVSAMIEYRQEREVKEAGVSPPRQAELLLAALTGCALLPLRRGTLHTEAEQIAHFLFEGRDIS
ncbi:DNA-binding transcriptional regulator, AcrR family [Fontibacillus panacisegetis]|uniref:DNA-binding transcriptional regulator, AcrR family n=1 Tax=Fontibacillus panacisegetis TaxID=670482 RepID=A0A1G7I7I3_9BACL|nr:TetR/AcrR family transcriptional regulator [Fontibacillus panacisegetis]SDF08319.1 DNA-binding transcriptional regulator, AcrR family [Fontibacillus panacisegetis]